VIIDAHAHLEPRMLHVDSMVEKLDAAGVPVPDPAVGRDRIFSENFAELLTSPR
jgi:hypothetical protein